MLQCVAVCCSGMGASLLVVSTVVCCRVLQYVAVCCSVLQYVAVYCNVLQWNGGITVGGANGSALECVAVCWSVLECVAVCCSVLQCVAVV